MSTIRMRLVLALIFLITRQTFGQLQNASPQNSNGMVRPTTSSKTKKVHTAHESSNLQNGFGEPPATPYKYFRPTPIATLRDQPQMPLEIDESEIPRSPGQPKKIPGQPPQRPGIPPGGRPLGGRPPGGRPPNVIEPEMPDEIPDEMPDEIDDMEIPEPEPLPTIPPPTSEPMPSGIISNYFEIDLNTLAGRSDINGLNKNTQVHFDRTGEPYKILMNPKRDLFSNPDENPRALSRMVRKRVPAKAPAKPKHSKKKKHRPAKNYMQYKRAMHKKKLIERKKQKKLKGKA